MRPSDPKYLPRYHVAMSMEPELRKSVEIASKVRGLHCVTCIIYGLHVGWYVKVTVPGATCDIEVSFLDESNGEGAKMIIKFGVYNFLDLSKEQLWDLIDVFAKPRLYVV